VSLGGNDRPLLGDLLSAELRARGAADLAPDANAAFDLALYDTQGAAIGGAEGELLASARLDNLASCHAAITALLGGRPGGESTRGIVLHDHEEVGSQSAAGAASLFVRSVLARTARAFAASGSDAADRAFARSLFISVDMAHAIHPSHADRHDPRHAPRLGGGPVVKVNASQSYATDAPGAAAFERACREVGLVPQRFVSRNDLRCGTTIGPLSAARLGVRTVDVGSPMLSMHSCRETAATAVVPKIINALASVLVDVRLPVAMV
jgi:aspartyl aminopeptidase